MRWTVAESMYKRKPTICCPAFMMPGCQDYFCAETGTEIPEYTGIYYRDGYLFRTWFENGERHHHCLGKRDEYIVSWKPEQYLPRYFRRRWRGREEQQRLT